MNKKYTIDINGSQIIEGSVDKISLTTFGDFSRSEDGQYRISYEETEATGFAGNTTTLTVENNQRATMLRTGRVHSNLIIEKGRKHLCHYDTGYGALTIGVFADKIENNLNEHGGSLRLRYKLDVNSNALSVNELNITVREN